MAILLKTSVMAADIFLALTFAIISIGAKNRLNKNAIALASVLCAAMSTNALLLILGIS